MKVVHISATPLAGSPIRIVNALNKYTDVQARSINLNENAYGSRTFPEDLLWNKNREECENLIREADILHFHHWFDFSSKENAFKFDFLSTMKKDAKYLIHWHSNPMVISNLTGQPAQEIVNTPIPQMVVAQFHESYFPNAYPVPLIVEVEGIEPNLEQRNTRPVVFYSPSRSRHAYEDRWETKGKPEVVELLDDLKKQGILDYKIIENAPFDECARYRADCDIVIDDIVTGAFHTTALEGLSVGKPTLSYLDQRTQMVLSQTTATTDCPIINVRYTEAKKVLKELAEDKALREKIGTYSRNWMFKYYNEKKMIDYYRRGYSELLETGTLNNNRYQSDREAKLWLYTVVPDLIWVARRDKDTSVLSRCIYLIRGLSFIKICLHKFPILRFLLRKVKRSLKYFLRKKL